MAIRFDTGTIRKPERTPEGYFLCEATFAREGILEYRDSQGNIRREFRPKEENEKALLGWAFKPVTLEHPTKLLDSSNVQEFSKGMSDSTVFLDGGFVRGVIIVNHADAIASIDRGDTKEISTGYKCRIDPTSGVWQGQKYDAIQRDIEVNHIALTKKGRAGSDVALHLDSDDPDVAYQSSIKKTMANLTIKGVTYDSIDPVVASAVGQYISELESSVKRADSLAATESELTKKVSTLESEIESLSEERDRYQGHADAYELIVNQAIPILEESGYSWNSDSEEFVLDSKKKPPMMDEDHEEEETSEEEEEEEKSYSKKSKKDSIANILEAWRKAEILGLNAKFDSDLDDGGIYELITSELLPDVDFSGASPAFLQGVVDRLILEAEETNFDSEDRSDSADAEFNLYSANLRDAVNLSRASENPNQKLMERSQAIASAWQEPLSLSKTSAN